MSLEFKKATKTQAKLRAALFGPSGAGKTFTALRIAKGMGGTVAVIDSERGSASKYADRFEFDTVELVNRDIPEYIDTIRAAAGYDVLIVDSLSHAWQELLEEIDRIAKTKYRGNSWAAWNEGTPMQKKLIGTILDFPGHVIVTMRSKTEWAQKQKDGKNSPERVGLAPEQRAGIEYEFDLLMSLTVDHIATIEKDRTGKFQDKIIEQPGEEFGMQMVTWLKEGAPAQPKPEEQSPEAKAIAWSLRQIQRCTTLEQLEKVREELKGRGGSYWCDQVKHEGGLRAAEFSKAVDNALV